MEFTVVPMRAELAREIVDWKYDGPFAFYDYDQEASHILDSEKWGRTLFAVIGEAGELCGELTVWFQDEAGERVPQAHADSGRLANCNLWIGFGMRPDLTGQGLGLAFVNTCAGFAAQFAREQFGFTGESVHLSVCHFNQRAVKVYERVGFVAYWEGSRIKNGVEYRTQRMKKQI